MKDRVLPAVLILMAILNGTGCRTIMNMVWGDADDTDRRIEESQEAAISRAVGNNPTERASWDAAEARQKIPR